MTEICKNCVHYEISCKDDGVLPNDFCGMYEALEKVQQEQCENWRKEHHFCDGCEYATAQKQCSLYADVFTIFKDE